MVSCGCKVCLCGHSQVLCVHHVRIHTTCSATAGEDFAQGHLRAVFAPGQREATVLLGIVDNAEVEPDEDLILEMVLGDLVSKGITVEENGQSMVTIQDNDGKYTCTLHSITI